MLRFLADRFVREPKIFYSTLEEISEEEKVLDESCKKILSFKCVISRIMQACIDEFKDTSVKDIEEKYIVGTPESLIASMIKRKSVKRKMVVYDKDAERIDGTRNEDTRKEEGKAFFDVKLDIINPESTKEEVFTMVMNIEAQDKLNVGYPIIKRGIYYIGRMLTAQYGTVFTKANYGLIKPCISIWVCPYPPQYRQNTERRIWNRY